MQYQELFINIAYIYTLCYLSISFVLFNSENPPSRVMKFLLLAFAMTGVICGIHFLRSGEYNMLSAFVVGFAGIIGLIFSFAKGSTSFAIFFRLICFFQLLASMIFVGS